MSEVSRAVAPLSRDEKLSLAIPIGYGTYLVTLCAAQLGLGALSLVVALKGDPEVAAAQRGAVIFVVVFGAVVGVAGAFLLRLNAIARFVIAALGGLGLVSALATEVSRLPQIVGTGIVALGLLIPPVGVWFADRDRGLGVPRRSFTAAVAWGTLVLTSFVVAPSFRKMFAETGLTLPALTEVVIALDTFAQDFGLFLVAPIVVVLGPFLLLGRDEVRTRVAVNVVGALAFGLVLLAYLLPLVELIRKL